MMLEIDEFEEIENEDTRYVEFDKKTKKWLEHGPTLRKISGWKKYNKITLMQFVAISMNYPEYEYFMKDLSYEDAFKKECLSAAGKNPFTGEITLKEVIEIAVDKPTDVFGLEYSKFKDITLCIDNWRKGNFKDNGLTLETFCRLYAKDPDRVDFYANLDEDAAVRYL